MKPFFSILIPVYNQVGLMDGCIASIQKQSFKDLEVVFVDDGSTDESLKMLEEFCAKDNRFKIARHEKNQSLLAARYTGMQNASGHYILFVDSDDYLSDNALELIHNKLAEEEVDILRFGYSKDFVDGYNESVTKGQASEEVHPLVTDNPLKAILEDKMVPNVWKNCYKENVIKLALERVQPFYCNMSEDVYWSVILFSCASTDGVLDEILYHYIIGNGMSTTTTHQTTAKIKKNMESVDNAIDNIRSFASKYAKWVEEYIEEKYITICCFLLIVAIIDETDYKNVVDILKVFDTEKTARVYEYGCNKALLYKVRTQYKITDEMLDELGVPYDKFSMK